MVSEYIPKCTHCGIYALPVCECGKVAYAKKFIHGKAVYTTFADNLADFKIVRGYFNTQGELVKTLPTTSPLLGTQSFIKGELK